MAEEVEVEVRGTLFPRLGSVLAIVPLGVWVVLHMWDNLYAWVGAEAWAEHVTTPAHALSEVLTGVIVFVPLLIHTVWGLRRLRMTRPNGYAYLGNVRYVLQRASAVGLLLFLGAHVYLARIRPALAGGHENFHDLAEEMRTAPTLTVYVLGILGTAYHLANGISTAAFIHGVAASPRAQRRTLWVAAALFVLMLLIGWGAVWGLWRAGATHGGS